MILQAIQTLIGEVPEGYEALEYVVCGALLLFILGEIFYGIGMIIKRVSKI